MEIASGDCMRHMSNKIIYLHSAFNQFSLIRKYIDYVASVSLAYWTMKADISNARPRLWVFNTQTKRLENKALSTLSQKSATVAENGETTATVADSRTFLRQCGQALRDIRTFYNDSVGNLHVKYLKGEGPFGGGGSCLALSLCCFMPGNKHYILKAYFGLMGARRKFFKLKTSSSAFNRSWYVFNILVAVKYVMFGS